MGRQTWTDGQAVGTMSDFTGNKSGVSRKTAIHFLRLNQRASSKLTDDGVKYFLVPIRNT